MTPQQALELLDRMVSAMRLSRPEHHQAVQAVQVLHGAVAAQQAQAQVKLAPAPAPAPAKDLKD